MSVEELKELQSKIIDRNYKINIISIISFTIVGIIILIIYSITGNESLFVLCIPLFIVTVIAVVIAKKVVNGKDIELFYKEYKNTFVLSTLKDNFENVEFNPDYGFSKEFINSVGMLDTSDRYSSNDYIKAKYKNITFEQSDIHIEEEHESTDSDGNTTTYYVTIFKGRLMIFDFNKNFKYNLQVASKYFAASSLPRNMKFNKIKMEDIGFNEKFKIYAENEHDAFYILTPHFMDKMEDLLNKLKCNLMFAFVDNKLHIAIDNRRDSFEYNVFKKLDENEVNANIKNDIKLITELVDELDLDNNLFRREV